KDQLGADVAVLVRINAPQMPRSLAVLGILPNGQIDSTFVNHRRGDDVVPRPPAAELGTGRLRIAVEFPEQHSPALFHRPHVERVEPAVGPGENGLEHAAELGDGWRRVSAVKYVLARRSVGPDNVTRVAVDCQKRRCRWRRNCYTRTVTAVARVEQHEVAE